MQNKIQNQTQPGPGNSGGNCKCEEKDTATQKLINTERKAYCNQLNDLAGNVNKWEENYAGLKELKKKKKCLFIWTEKNYQEFRNLEIKTGISLLQFKEYMKGSVADFLKSNKAVSDGLKDVVKKLKDMNAKMGDLNAAADDLKRCKKEDCNKVQWAILTGDWSKCKDVKPETGNRPPECDKVQEKFDDLLCMPQSLKADSDLLYKASADVVGIQVFSNVGTLDGLQKKLDEKITAFEKNLQDTIKKDQDDLKKAQDDLTAAVKSFADSKNTLYGSRCEFTGAFETAKVFCCPDCNCIKDKKCEERLKCCKEDICKICNEVQGTFCDCEPQDQQQC